MEPIQSIRHLRRRGFLPATIAAMKSIPEPAVRAALGGDVSPTVGAPFAKYTNFPNLADPAGGSDFGAGTTQLGTHALSSGDLINDEETFEWSSGGRIVVKRSGLYLGFMGLTGSAEVFLDFDVVLTSQLSDIAIPTGPAGAPERRANCAYAFALGAFDIPVEMIFSVRNGHVQAFSTTIIRLSDYSG